MAPPVVGLSGGVHGPRVVSSETLVIDTAAPTRVGAAETAMELSTESTWWMPLTRQSGAKERESRGAGEPRSNGGIFASAVGGGARISNPSRELTRAEVSIGAGTGHVGDLTKRTEVVVGAS